jgi:hypothetical protein
MSDLHAWRATLRRMRRDDADRWRSRDRLRALHLLTIRTRRLGWSRALVLAVLEELHVDDQFVDLIGRPDRLSARDYPHALAMALAIRYSWQRADLTRLARQLGVSLSARALDDHEAPDPHADPAYVTPDAHHPPKTRRRPSGAHDAPPATVPRMKGRKERTHA